MGENADVSWPRLADFLMATDMRYTLRLVGVPGVLTEKTTADSRGRCVDHFNPPSEYGRGLRRKQVCGQTAWHRTRTRTCLMRN